MTGRDRERGGDGLARLLLACWLLAAAPCAAADGTAVERLAARTAALEALHLRARLDPEGPARALIGAPPEPSVVAEAVRLFAAAGDRDGASAALALAGAEFVGDALPAPSIAALAQDGAVAIGPEHLGWLPSTGLLSVQIVSSVQPRRAPVQAPAAGADRAEIVLAGLVARGRAAGLAGTLYDNRDRGHSDAFAGRVPHVPVRTSYAEQLRAIELDYGINGSVSFSGVVLGNSSTAISAGPLSRSQPRLAMTLPWLAAAAAELYASNHLYVYPAHRDYGPQHGDRFPAVVPFFVVSEGSSGSDRLLVRALADALAALLPETRGLAETKGLIGPTLQMLLRRAIRGIDSDAAYLSSAAHPSAFDGAKIDRERLVRTANGLAAGSLPGAPVLSMLSEDAMGPPVDPFSGIAAERLFDTPSAVARVALGPATLRRYALRAAAADPNGRAVRFRWSVLRGEGVRIETTGSSDEVALIEVPWQAPVAVPGRPEIVTARVDVAAFADNGSVLSAPAYFSVDFTVGGLRSVDAAGRVLEIDYTAAADPRLPPDPLLSPLRPWRDLFDYGPDGAPTGWLRIRGDGEVAAYSAGGGLILERDALGRPTKLGSVGYGVDPAGMLRGRLRLLEVPGDRVFRVLYDHPQDRVGRFVAENP